MLRIALFGLGLSSTSMLGALTAFWWWGSPSKQAPVAPQSIAQPLLPAFTTTPRSVPSPTPTPTPLPPSIPVMSGDMQEYFPCVRVLVEGVEMCASGVAVGNSAKGGLVLTAHHVNLQSTGSILYKGETYPVDPTLSKDDPDNDLAVLTVPGLDLPKAVWGSAQTGEPIKSFGYSNGVTKLQQHEGVVEQVGSFCGTVRTRKARANKSCYRVSTGVIFPGNSGGGIGKRIESGYQLIGVSVTMQESNGTGRVIPSEIIQKFLSQVR